MNLIEEYKKAIANKGQWKGHHVRMALEHVCAQLPESEVEWDEGDEMWGRVILPDDDATIVSVEYPLIITKETGLKACEGLLFPMPVQILLIPDFDEPAFDVDREELQEVLGVGLSRNLDYHKLTVNELWWATVT